eukprot:6209560-Pleurochrysis_carterae.AAC.1
MGILPGVFGPCVQRQSDYCVSVGGQLAGAAILPARGLGLGMASRRRGCAGWIAAVKRARRG